MNAIGMSKWHGSHIIMRFRQTSLNNFLADTSMFHYETSANT